MRGPKHLLLLLLALFLLAHFSVWLPFGAASTGQAYSSSGGAYVKRIDHTFAVQENGLAVLNDTVALTVPPGEGGTVSIKNFSIGFPWGYRPNLVFCLAYDSSNPNRTFDVVLDSGIGKAGFYGVTVLFPENTTLQEGDLFNFTVTFVFENLISPKKLNATAAAFNITFPLYPSIPQKAETCGITLILPKYMERKATPQVDFDVRDLSASWQVYTRVEDHLQPFAYQPALIEFIIHAESRLARSWLRVVDVLEVEREIRIDEWRRVVASDTYRIINAGTEPIKEVKVRLPENASDVMVSDEVGNQLNYKLVSPEENVYSVSLRLSLTQNSSERFRITYQVPWEKYVSQEKLHAFTFKTRPFDVAYKVVNKLTVRISLPSGAKFRGSSLEPQVLQRDALQEKVVFVFYNATPLHNLDINITYDYPVFWASYYPTIWTGAVVGVVCLVALLRRISKPAPAPARVPAIVIRPEVFRDFIESYEEKAKILSELDSIERQVRRGKIPRRRYKVRRRTLESKLSSISKDLAVLKEQLRSASPRYADVIRQLEISEAEFEEADAGIRRVSARYRRGEISREAYHSLLREYKRRKDEARVAIQGVLLRLREEIH